MRLSPIPSLRQRNVTPYTLAAPSHSRLLDSFIAYSWLDRILILGCAVPAYVGLHVFVVVVFGVGW